jgi:nucleotide-binding universal stress UspA family protein
MEPTHPERALVAGHDGTAASTAALATGIELAHLLNARIHIVHIITIDDYGIDPDSDEFERTRDRNVAHERSTITDTLTRTDIAWTYHEERGDPAHQLASLAAEVDASFIIVGATSRGMLHTLLSGSVPNRLLHVQGRPVIVVPAVSDH